jgi:hypothetical protein
MKIPLSIGRPEVGVGLARSPGLRSKYTCKTVSAIGTQRTFSDSVIESAFEATYKHKGYRQEQFGDAI